MNQKQIISIFLETILDPITQTYKEVITLSAKPSGPLSTYVKCISRVKLSDFKEYNSLPIFVLYNDCEYMTIDDITDVFTILLSNGYIIEESLTKIVSKFNQKRIICMFSYPL
jgi:hypothetical protein